MRLLDRPDISLQPGNRVVLPAEIDRLFCEEKFHEPEGFLKVADAGTRLSKRNPHLLKLSRADSCTQAEFKAALGEQIQRGGFSGEQHRMAVLITEHITANAQRSSCLWRPPLTLAWEQGSLRSYDLAVIRWHSQAPLGSASSAVIDAVRDGA